MNDKDKSRKPIFIVGCARSGTTLLQSILSSHPRIAIPPEEDFIMRLYPSYCQGKPATHTLSTYEIEAILNNLYNIEKAFRHWNLDSEALKKRITQGSPATYAETMAEIYTAFAEQFPGKTRWGCKTTYYALHIDRLAKLFPEAQFIHIIRDGRNAFLSMRDRRRQGEKHLTSSVIKGAWIWRRLVSAAKATGTIINNEFYHEVGYEDLVTEPERTIKKLCLFLHEEEAIGCMMNHYDNETTKKMLNPYNDSKYLKPEFDRSKLQRWKSELSYLENLVFEAIAGDVLETCKYELRNRKIVSCFWIIMRLLDRISFRRLNRVWS